MDGTAPRRLLVVRTRMSGGGDEAEYFLLLSLPPSPPAQELASVTHQAECTIKSSLVGAMGVFGGVGRVPGKVAARPQRNVEIGRLDV